MSGPLATALIEKLGCDLPIVQTAMGWIAEPELVAASCNAGAFGFLGAAVMTPEEAEEKIVRLREMTPHTFGVNFHAFQPGANRIMATIVDHADRIGAVSFGRGPNAEMIARFRDAGISCMPTVGALKHAQKMAELGCDIITVQGGEGGGHTGSVPTTILLPQVLDAIDIPVVAAGGFADGRGLVAALSYGAAGIAMGTRFLLTAESPLASHIKRVYLDARTDDIFVTRKVDGLPQRMVRTKTLDRIEQSGRIGMWKRALEGGLAMKKRTGASWGEMIKAARGMTSHGGLGFAQAMLAAAAPTLIQKAVVDGNLDEGILATGLVAGRIGDLPSCAELIGSIAADARERIDALAGSAAPQPA
ncbi:MAG: nitronate monooxygenase [Pseudomonadota bacterium]